MQHACDQLMGTMWLNFPEHVQMTTLHCKLNHQALHKVRHEQWAHPSLLGLIMALSSESCSVSDSKPMLQTACPTADCATTPMATTAIVCRHVDLFDSWVLCPGGGQRCLQGAAGACQLRFRLVMGTDSAAYHC